MSLSVLGALLVHAVLLPAAERADCRGEPATRCPDGLAGPTCDIPCPGPGGCTHALQCHGSGETAGLSLFGAPLFALRPEWPDWLVRLALVRFVVEHPGAFGLAGGLRAEALELAPARAFEVRAGGLRLLRFRQRYRGIPVFGGDVTVIAGPDGATGIRGTLIDGRDEYVHFGAHAPEAAGEASILAHAAARARLPASALRVVGLRLVAFRRTRTLGWAGVVTHGGALVAHVVVEADPAAAPAPLLYHISGEGHGLADEVAIAVRAEDMASAIFEPPVESIDVSQLPGGAALTGSTAGASTRLADRRVVVVDAAGATSRSQALASPVYADGPFDAEPGARGFDFQSAYVWLQSFHARTDAIMDGRWDSLLPFFGLESAVPPGELSPRLVAAFDTAASLCGATASYCVSSAWGGADDEPSEALQHPAAEPPYEMVGALYVKGTALPPSILPHEFGHLVDLFAGPGLFYEPYACAACWSSCDPGTTDESVPLTETFANLMALWYYSELFAQAGQSSACTTLGNASGGQNRSPHNAACRPTGSTISYFLHNSDPGCPPSDGWPDYCDRPEPDDIDTFDGIGLCDRRAGYEVDSWYQAFWELLHGETCSPSPPYTCEPLPTLSALPASQAVGEALLFAAQVSSGTYDGFADDIATYFACNYGQVVYDEVNEVLCHHEIRACDAPAPVLCEFCGDGVRTGDEACDGGDLGGRTCEDLGLLSGALACDAACAFDVSQCEGPGPGDATTSASTTGPDASTGPLPTTSHSSGSGEPEPPGGLFIDSEQSTGGDAGCACRYDGAGGTSSVVGLALLLLRRRRRA